MGGTSRRVSYPCHSLRGFSFSVTYQVQAIYIEPLDGLEKLTDLESRETNHLITTIGVRVADNHQRVDVAVWQEAKYSFPVAGLALRQGSPIRRLEGCHLQRIGDDIAVGDHNPLLYPRKPELSV